MVTSPKGPIFSTDVIHIRTQTCPRIFFLSNAEKIVPDSWTKFDVGRRIHLLGHCVQAI